MILLTKFTLEATIFKVLNKQAFLKGIDKISNNNNKKKTGQNNAKQSKSIVADCGG